MKATALRVSHPLPLLHTCQLSHPGGLHERVRYLYLQGDTGTGAKMNKVFEEMFGKISEVHKCMDWMVSFKNTVTTRKFNLPDKRPL